LFIIKGISPGVGACVAKATEVRTFKEFFIQLELPYKASRYEKVPIRATIFNYVKATLKVCFEK